MAELPPPVLPEALPAKDLVKSTRTKTTLNLHGILNPSEPIQGNNKGDLIQAPVANHSVSLESLTVAWNEYAELRKHQMAEYHLLKREFHFDHPVIEVHLTNPVEETILDNFRREFIQFLRERLKNGELTIRSSVKEMTGRKVIYTSKEKFEHLAEKNPYLNELKDRLGLDWDF